MNGPLVPGCLLEEGVYYGGQELGEENMGTYNRLIHITLIKKNFVFVFHKNGLLPIPIGMSTLYINLEAVAASNKNLNN